MTFRSTAYKNTRRARDALAETQAGIGQRQSTDPSLRNSLCRRGCT
jgi:hypothetical protein